MKETSHGSRFIIGQPCEDVCLWCFGGYLTPRAAAIRAGSLTPTNGSSALNSAAVSSRSAWVHSMLDNTRARSAESIAQIREQKKRCGKQERQVSRQHSFLVAVLFHEQSPRWERDAIDIITRSTAAFMVQLRAKEATVDEWGTPVLAKKKMTGHGPGPCKS